MSEEFAAPPHGSAESPHSPDSTTSRTLTGDDSQRQSRRDLLSPKKGGSTHVYPVRHLSPSPAPSSRLSIDSQLSTRHSNGPVSPSSEGSPLQKFWIRNKGAILVAASQLFGALMNLSARLLELDGEGMHPVQALLIRQSLTSILCLLYMWWTKTPDGPFGHKSLKWLLLLRGFGGFFGIYGMWYSMMYLPLADATVITFLAPGIAGFICYFVLKEPFTRIEQLASLVALAGVVLIAQPTTFFATSNGVDPTTAEAAENSGLPGLDHEATPRERLLAIGMALVGALGAATAFTTLRVIGKRASPIISVNMFGLICTGICSVILLSAPYLNIDQPALRWVWPHAFKGWALLMSLGVLGFGLQYLLTAGLAADKSNRANAMVYTHMLFAASFDRWIFHHEMDLMSFGGCALILCSAIGVVLMRKPPPPKVDDVERQGNIVGNGEMSPMLVGVGGNGDDLILDRLR